MPRDNHTDPDEAIAELEAIDVAAVVAEFDAEVAERLRRLEERESEE